MSKAKRASRELADIAAIFDATVHLLNDDPKTRVDARRYNHISDRLNALNEQASHLTPNQQLAACS